ncbi:hypothetical protein BT69DRAFT_29195 [Atractiella rhizophila]|nr:hypothetical protein BT69DRAFT_29195 [Atractiella rhizophila]
MAVQRKKGALWKKTQKKGQKRRRYKRSPKMNRVLSVQAPAAATATTTVTTAAPAGEKPSQSLSTTEYTPHARNASLAVNQPATTQASSSQLSQQTRAPFTFPLPPTPSDILITQREVVSFPPPSPPAVPLEPLPEREEGLMDLDDLDKLTNEQAPWRASGANQSDYFNYGFDERDWKVYRLRQKYGEGRTEPPKQRGGEGGGKPLTFKEEMPFAAFAFGNVREAYLSLPAPLKTLMLSTILSASGYPPQIFVQLSNPAFQQMIMNMSAGNGPPNAGPNANGPGGMMGMMGGMGMNMTWSRRRCCLWKWHDG